MSITVMDKEHWKERIQELVEKHDSALPQPSKREIRE